MMNEKVKNKQRKKGLFVVGLGASAGGLDPLKHFFKSLPEETGMAFIVIAHLSPEHKSNLAELLQMHSPLKILQVKKRTRMEQDHVYVIPPKKLLSIADDYIELSDTDKMMRHAAVDVLFSSLGEAMGEHSAVVILSGTGSGGTEGIKMVKEHGGFIIAQDPGEAEYSDMPKNAINSGLVDMVLPVDSMASELFQYRETINQGRFDGEEDGRVSLHRTGKGSKKSLNYDLEDKIEELRRSNSDLKNLMEATDIGILLVDRDLCVQLFTSSMTNIFNLNSEDQGHPLEYITHKLRYDSLINDLKNVRDSHDTLKRVVKSGDNRYYNLQLRPYRSGEDSVEGVVLTFIDITQLREVEEILKHQKQQESLASLGLYALERLDLPSIMHRASQQVCMILETDYALLYTLNEENNALQLSAYTGLTIDEEKNKEIKNNEESDAGYALRRKDPVIVKNYLEEERFHISPLVEGFDIECGCHVRIIGTHDVYGVLSIYSGKKLSLLEDDLNYVQIMANLIGMSIERKEAKRILEETNKELTKEIQKSEQYQREILNTSIAERWQLGGYLHDNLAQILASVKIMLADIHQNLPDSNSDIKKSVTALNGIIDEAMSGIRDLTHDIIPIDIEEEGVEHAFRFLIRQTQKLHNVNCKLDTDESIGKIKNRKLATNIYHVVQEAIKNAAVHGKAKNIEVSMMESKGDIILKVTDDGAGLLNVPKEMKGKGLRIMKHRMELLGGTFDLKERSGPDTKGLILTCTIPFEDLHKREK